MKSSAFGRHKAAAAIAAGHDPGSFLRTGTAKPKGWKRKYRRGQKRWTAKKQLILEALRDMDYKSRMKALEGIYDNEILIACGVNPNARSRGGNLAKPIQAIKIKSGARSLRTSDKKLNKKPFHPKWKRGGKVRSPDPIESKLVDVSVATARDAVKVSTHAENVTCPI